MSNPHNLEERMKEEFLDRFFEMTYLDAHPYDNSYKDEEKINWWLSKLSDLKQKIEYMKYSTATFRAYDENDVRLVYRKSYNQALSDVLDLFN